ncbi:MAG TPA: hypothetical protein VEX68_04435 [Bryobacteraceae bacterium]|nr:hypothetical protein [Bryobacteraceae bacterium]
MNVRIAVLALASLALQVLAAEPSIKIDSPMPTPAWALLERQLLNANSRAADRFFEKFVDDRGYLLHTPRWGTLDGPDDAIETFFNWTLLHAMGGSNSVLTNYKKALEGHYKQYGQLRTTLTKLSENGSYYKEFITQSDWFHTGEGMRAFMFLGLSDPNNQIFRERMKRFAGLYMNEDLEAPNYDPKNKLIKSIWTGSKGPMMHKATEYDWVGDPVPGSFHLLHNKAGRGKLLNLNEYYPKMLAHCKDYLDSVGDHPLNLASTNLGLQAFALTQQPKYKDWVVEYATAWKTRTEQCGGNIPTNVGLDGKPGGEYGGQWWKGTYGWNFTIYDGELEEIAHRNTFTAGAWPGFGNALMLTGDQAFVGVLRKQLDNIYAQKKVVDGKTLLPQMYGDPKGYHEKGAPSWYHYTGNLFQDKLAEIYFWSMDRKDLERVPIRGWVAFLEGKDPEHPVKTLQADLEKLRKTVVQIETDPTTADTRLADYLQDLNPVETDALANLTMGAYFSNGRIWGLHSRFRYFDPVRRRAGLPEDVAALVEKLEADGAMLTLVNVDPVEARTLVVQAGGYGEHRFESVEMNGKTTPIAGPLLNVRLEPGAGARLRFRMARYVNPPTLAFPWDRGWFGKQ